MKLQNFGDWHAKRKANPYEALGVFLVVDESDIRAEEMGDTCKNFVKT